MRERWKEERWSYWDERIRERERGRKSVGVRKREPCSLRVF